MAGTALYPRIEGPKIRPPLDPGFMPAVLWNRSYRLRSEVTPDAEDLTIGLGRPDGTMFVHRTRILPPTPENAALNRTFVERLVKFLLWQRGGSRITISGSEAVARMIRDVYCAHGARLFDWNLLGDRTYGEPMTVSSRAMHDMPPSREAPLHLGRHLDGCRIGFDLGGSDRKCAALIDGKLVYSEEIPWQPYFEKDPQYHYEGINDSIRRAAERLPRVDAIGGSAAGIYVHNEPRVASLFRGVSGQEFESRIRPIFHRLKHEWGDIPFEVVNDGAVTALAGSMSLHGGAVLGLAMGTSLASGYCDSCGHLTSWLNELAFAPIDYQASAPVDEWSGDAGCGVQYLSQQAVARLAPRARLILPAGMSPAEKLVQVQYHMARGDDRARRIYQTIGVYLGYALAHYADFYDVENVLILGRVTSGDGGAVILTAAENVLHAEFPELAARARLHIPGEQLKRHGQAIAAASLPETEEKP